jgi:hypothetical protein
MPERLVAAHSADAPAADRLTLRACGVMSATGVFVDAKRTFSNPAYEWVFLRVTASELRALRDFCKQQMGKPMNVGGARRSPFWPRASRGDSWYCAEFCVAALQHIGMLQTFNPGSLMIDEIHHLLRSSERLIYEMTPLERQRISTVQSSLFAYSAAPPSAKDAKAKKKKKKKERQNQRGAQVGINVV